MRIGAPFRRRFDSFKSEEEDAYVECLLKAEHIQISFGNVHALKDVSLEIVPGEIHCLAGENGCGKSTLIKIISGVSPAAAGAPSNLMERNWKRLHQLMQQYGNSGYLSGFLFIP